MPDRDWPAGVERADVLAGGGVVVRERPGGPEVVVVHRPRYDDWSLPKGKLDRGESVLDAAVREVAEETGLTVVPVAVDDPWVVRYVDGKGRAKEVRYWRMHVVGDDAVDPGDLHPPDDEVDRVEWWPLRRARSELSYDHDRALLAPLADGERGAGPRLGPGTGPAA
jgi:8-oxo-dGTP pyrophosphatase MutT (NUDIX family)